MNDMLSDMLDTTIQGVYDRDTKDHMMNDIMGICGYELPTAYKSFLYEYGAGLVRDNYVYKPIEKTPITNDVGTDSMDVFYGLSDTQYNLFKKISEHIDTIGISVIPIGGVLTGDLVCMGITPDNAGKIYYWYHENELEFDDGSQIFYLIANTFEDFIMSFEYIDDNASTESTGVVKMKLDPELMKLLPKQNK